jgi:hypothetical protein
MLLFQNRIYELTPDIGLYKAKPQRWCDNQLHPHAMTLIQIVVLARPVLHKVDLLG